MTIVMETHNSRIALQYKRRYNVWREKNGYLQTLESVVFIKKKRRGVEYLKRHIYLAIWSIKCQTNNSPNRA